jgi:hypothetical protein
VPTIAVPPLGGNQPPVLTIPRPVTTAPLAERVSPTPTATELGLDGLPSTSQPWTAEPVDAAPRGIASDPQLVTAVVADQIAVTAGLVSSIGHRVADMAADILTSVSTTDAGVAVGMVTAAALGVAVSGSVSSAGSGSAGVAVGPLTSALLAAVGTRRFALTLRQSSWRLSQDPGFAPD